MPKKDKAFSTLTKRERKLLHLDDNSGEPFKSSTEELADRLTRGVDKKKLDKDMKRMGAEWEG